MKRTLKPICFTILTLSLMHARAESADVPWSGSYGQLGAIGYGSYMPKQSFGTTTVSGYPVAPTAFNSKRINGYIGNISAGYYFDLHQDYLLGIGATLYPGKSKSASTVALAHNLPTYGTYNIADIYSIYLTPGYSPNKHQFIYGKVGYTEATVHSSADGNAHGNFPEQTSHMNGIVYGFGYKQIISESIYLFGEVNYAVDKPKQVSITTPEGYVVSSTAKASGYDLVLGVGYRF